MLSYQVFQDIINTNIVRILFAGILAYVMVVYIERFRDLSRVT